MPFLLGLLQVVNELTYMVPIVTDAVKYMAQSGDISFFSCVMRAICLEDIDLCLKKAKSREFAYRTLVQWTKWNSDSVSISYKCIENYIFSPNI